MPQNEEIDDVTANAIAEETDGPNTAASPAPVTPPEVEVEASPEPSVKTEDDQIGEFADPDYADIMSDRDRLEEPPVEETVARPLDPVIPVAAPVAAVAEPVVSTPVPESIPQSVGQQVPAPPAPTPREVISPEQQAADFAQLEQEIAEGLQALYIMSPEEAAKLDEFEQKPSEYLPGLLAKAHQNAYTHAYQAIMDAIPQVMNQVSQTTQVQNQAENAFFNRWPDLKGQEDVAMRAITTYRNMNPQATLQESIERSGMLAMIELGKNPLSDRTQPAAPARENPAFTPPPRPAQPGSFGSGLRAAPRSYEEGVYEEIYRDEQNFGKG